MWDALEKGEVWRGTEMLRKQDGQLYEASGIPVDVMFDGDFFDRSDRLAGEDRGLDFVAAWLAANPAP